MSLGAVMLVGSLAVLPSCAALGVEEHDAVRVLIWAKRGAELAELAQLYCDDASARARRTMREAIEHRGGRTRVVIFCPDDARRFRDE